MMLVKKQVTLDVAGSCWFDCFHAAVVAVT